MSQEISYEVHDSKTITSEFIEEMALLYWEDFVEDSLRDKTPEFYSQSRFVERVSKYYVHRPNFRCITARSGEDLVGFVTAANLRDHDHWWELTDPDLRKKYADAGNGHDILAIFDLLVKADYRDQSIASSLYQKLLSSVSVQYIILLSSKPQQPAYSIWKHWGYEAIATKRFEEDGPELDLFLLHDNHSP